MKILVWARWIDDVCNNSNPPDTQGGAEVQMAFWARLLASYNHKVFVFSWRRNFIFIKKDNIRFLWIPWFRKIGVIFWKLRFLYLFILRPDFIIVRSYTDLEILSKLKKCFNYKIIFMLASDKIRFSNKLVSNESLMTVIEEIDLFVSQNSFQTSKLKQIIKNNLIIEMPNIFDRSFFSGYEFDTNKKFDFIWVSNIKALKRIELFIEISKKLKDCNFAIVGKMFDNSYFPNLLNEIESCKNITYFGSKSYIETTRIIAQSKILINTSLFEGFPNTFLQAWYFGLPVISTVDPNDIISKNKLGFVQNNLEGLINACQYIINSDGLYEELNQNVIRYFSINHKPEEAYNTISEFF